MESYELSPKLLRDIDRLDRELASSARQKPHLFKRNVHAIFRPLFDQLNRNPDAWNSFQSAFYSLVDRCDSAKTVEELRAVLRDIRQFAMTSSSFSQTSAIERRIHELEGRLQTAAQSAVQGTVGDGVMDNSDVVTLDSLASKRVLFAIMPFADEFTDVWSGGIKRAASGTGLTPIRIDMITKTSEITDDIVGVIRMAEVVVVDVTRNNANVMFEFGFALALKKPYVVISQSTEYLTFDIKNFRSLIYQNSWHGIEALHKDLQSYIRGANSKRVQGTAKKRPKAKKASGPTHSKASGRTHSATG